MSIQETTHVDEGAVIALTEGAVAKVKELIAAEAEENLALRVAVRPGGCSGFSYEMFFDTDIASDDLTSDAGGVNVVVDPASAGHLRGASHEVPNWRCDGPAHSARRAGAREKPRQAAPREPVRGCDGGNPGGHRGGAESPGFPTGAGSQ